MPLHVTAPISSFIFGEAFTEHPLRASHMLEEKVDATDSMPAYPGGAGSQRKPCKRRQPAPFLPSALSSSDVYRGR